MGTETLETPTADETAEEAALVSAFAQTSTETPAPEGTTTPATTEEVPAKETPAEETPAAAPAAAAPVVEWAQFTKQEKDDVLKVLAMRSKIDEVLGTLGNIQNEVKQMRGGGHGAVTVAKEDFQELIENQFPEFAGFLTAGLNRILGRMKPGAGVDVKEAMNALRGPLLQEAEHMARNASCVEYLNDEHEGWQQLVGLPDAKTGAIPDTEFRRWAAKTYPKEQHDRIFKSKNGPMLSKVIERFKNEQQTKGTSPAKPPADPKAEQRKALLAAGVDPKGDPAHGATTQSEEDEFVAATNETLKKRGGLA